MSVRDIECVAINPVASGSPNGHWNNQYINTNAAHIITVTVGSQGSYTVEGVSYDMPTDNYLVFIESATPGTEILSETVTYISGDDDMFNVGQNVKYGTAATFPSQAPGYSRIGGGGGSTRWRPVEPDYHYDTFADFDADFQAGNLQPKDQQLQYDVYINGTKDPAITIIPTYAVGEGLSTLAMTARYWRSVVPNVIHNDHGVINVDGYNVPDVDKWYVGQDVSIDLLENYNDQYLSISNALSHAMTIADKIKYFDLDGIPPAVRLLLRFDYLDTSGQEPLVQWGDLYAVEIPREVSSVSDIDVIQILSSKKNNPEYITNVVIHLGAPPDFVDPDSDEFPGGKDIDGDDGGVYNDPSNLPDFSATDGAGFDGNAVLTKTYAVTASVLQNIGSKLWSQSYFNVLKVQTNPIENIVAVKAFPFGHSGTSKSIVVGDIDFQIQGDEIPCVEKKTIGTFKYVGAYGNFLDFSPYTIIKMFLPYCGWVQLDASMIYKVTLTVDYIIDKITGDCLAKITGDGGRPIMDIKGNMGIEIPLTATNNIQAQIKQASAVISTVGGTAGHVIAGDAGGAALSAASGALTFAGMDMDTQRSGAPSPMCSSFINHGVYVVIERPEKSSITPSEGYKHLHGYPCHKYKNLGSLSGFVQVDTRSDISIAMTADENRMLENLLTSGVYTGDWSLLQSQYDK